VWIPSLSVSNLRSIEHAEIRLDPGLNVFIGSNAQGKTTLLEAVALLARGRSFRAEQVAHLVRHGSATMSATAVAIGDERETQLEVRVEEGRRQLRLGGRLVPPREYHGRLEALVYSSQRQKIVYGAMRDRRSYFDRAGAALWPAYRQLLGEYDRVLTQRNAALEGGQGGNALAAWDERLCAVGARLWLRRAAYLQRLQAALERGFKPRDEHYQIVLRPVPPSDDVQGAAAALASALAESRPAERRSQRTQVGPHRDAIELLVDGQDAALWASAGQARSLLLALTEAALYVYKQEHGTSAVALLDDIDSELDEQRALDICQRTAREGQTLITTAHQTWGRGLGASGRVFEVEQGRIRPL
jgi:DNA replication and repair protein RecF